MPEPGPTGVSTFIPEFRDNVRFVHWPARATQQGMTEDCFVLIPSKIRTNSFWQLQRISPRLNTLNALSTQSQALGVGKAYFQVSLLRMLF